MNLLLIIEGTYPWYRGGVSEWVYQYIKNRSNFKFYILQIATDTFIELSPEDALYPIPENVVQFKRVPPPDLINDWDSSLSKWYINISADFNKYSKQCEVIHVTNTGFAGWLGYEISKEINQPLVLTEHAVYWLEVLKGAVALECGYKIPEGSIPKNEVVTLFKNIAKKVYQKADKVITVSECNIPLQEQFGASYIEYIPNGIPSSWISDSVKNRSQPVFGWVGRCAEMKNPLQFFDFIEEFKSHRFDSEFLMLLSDAGEYELEKKVRKQASKYTELRVIWNQPAKEYYKEMDLLLITSHNESQPLVMFEALSKMVLPVGRAVGDLTDKYGLTFPKTMEINEICSEIIQFWNNSQHFLNYIEERFSIVKKEHTWDTIFNKYEDVIIKTVQDYGTD